MFYHSVRFLGRIYFQMRLSIQIEGEHFIPPKGPFILVLNHVSDIDPFLAHVFCPRLLSTMTKSSAFRFKVVRILGPLVGAFPTLRFRVDPQAVRVALRLLLRGKAVGVFPEGERSWDGKLRDIKMGTVKFLLKANVPVIPCGIVGTYNIAPRWGKMDLLNLKGKRETVILRYGEPIFFGSHNSRSAREKAFLTTRSKVENSLLGLTT